MEPGKERENHHDQNGREVERAGGSGELGKIDRRDWEPQIIQGPGM